VKGFSSKKVSDLVVAAEKAPGWWVEKGGKHVKIFAPGGRHTIVSKTVDDGNMRNYLNTRAQLRRMGLDV
jgi:hypothetical protein